MVYATAIAYEENGESVYRRKDAKDGLKKARFGDLFSMLENVAKSTWDKASLGRNILDENLEPTEKWHFETFGEFMSSVVHVSNGLMERKELCPLKTFTNAGYAPAEKLRTIGIVMRNSPDWFRMEYACARSKIVMVPIYQTFGVDAMLSIVKETELDTIITTADILLNKLVGLDLPVSNYVISSNGHNSSYTPRQKDLQNLKSKYNIMTIDELMYIGEKHPRPREIVTSDDVWTICYTSGTTGNPKGGMLTHGNCMSTIETSHRFVMDKDQNLNLTSNDRHFSYLPLEHIFERTFSGLILATGSSIACFNNKVDLLFDFLKSSGSTVFISVPRLYEKINQKVMELIGKKGFLTQLIFNTAFKTKRNKYLTYGQSTHSIYDPLVFNPTIRPIVGDKIRFFISGGAPLNPEIKAAMCSYFSVIMVEGYGLTENCGISAVTHTCDLSCDEVGHVVPQNEFKIRDVEELGYYVSNRQGELLMRGNGIFKGYFKHKDQTDSVMSSDGWLSTGDVVELGPLGGIKIIDRRGHCFKLSQGEFIAPERIETVLNLNVNVLNVFITGKRTESCLVGFVIPSDTFLLKWRESYPGMGDKEILDIDEVSKGMIVELRKTGLSNGLHSYEVPKVLCFLTLEDCEALKLMTPTFKLKRKILDKVMIEEIESMYKDSRSLVYSLVEN